MGQLEIDWNRLGSYVKAASAELSYVDVVLTVVWGRSVPSVLILEPHLMEQHLESPDMALRKQVLLHKYMQSLSAHHLPVSC